MALEIIWTLQAEKGLQKVIDYLEQDWTIKEILKLEENITQVTNQIKFFLSYIQNLKHIKICIKQ